MTEYVLAAVVVVLIIAIIVLIFRQRKAESGDVSALEQKLLFALASQTSIKEIQQKLEGLPRDLMQSITGSMSKRTGKLNELMATFELTKYDRLFYLGEPIDFIGVKYGEGIDFIEVPAFFFLAFWIILQLISGALASSAEAAAGGVAWWAHIGGFASGVALLPFFKKRGRRL